MSNSMELTSVKSNTDLPTSQDGLELTSVKHVDAETPAGSQALEVVTYVPQESDAGTSQTYDNAAYAQDDDAEGSVSSQKKQADGDGDGIDANNSVAIDMENQDTDDDDDDEISGFMKKVDDWTKASSRFWTERGDAVTWCVYALFIAGYSAYLAYAMTYEFGSESSIRLLWMSLCGPFGCAIVVIRDYWGHWIHKYMITPIVNFVERHWLVCKWSFILAVLAFVVVFIIVEVAIDRPENMVSLLGYLIYIFLLFVFSAFPALVWWRPVLWGFGLQFFFALLVLRTYWGYEAFKWLGDRVQEFLEYADAGSEFVFGEKYLDHPFAMQVMPVVIFFSSTISILYYWGWMQAIIEKIAWLMECTMGTTAAESTNAAGNIFIGQTEAPLLIRPLLNDMTSSELHAVMVGGYATIAGSVMATYIMFGVPANHLITASVMAAPCALAVSKLFYPETEVTKATISKMEDSPYHNTVEAAAAGASMACKLVANITANLIAFIALLEFVNTTLTWMGHRVGLWAPEYPELTFELICSYVLWPFAFIMGVAVEDCRKVAELIGVKTFLNEFVAYQELGVIIDNTKIFNEYNGTYEESWDSIYLVDTNQTLYGGVMHERSILISTYALCGFANISSIGMVIGALGGLAPKRQSEIAKLGAHAMIAGNVVCFMNACTAGLLYNEME